MYFHSEQKGTHIKRNDPALKNNKNIIIPSRKQRLLQPRVLGLLVKVRNLKKGTKKLNLAQLVSHYSMTSESIVFKNRLAK